MPTTRFGICPLCEAICGIAVDVEGDRVIKIRGDERDPLSRGYICPKATALEDIRTDPDRLLQPMRRTGDRWQEVGWDEALDEAGTRLSAIQKSLGRDAVGIYVGNPTIHDYGAILFGLVLAQILRTKSMFSSNSVDGLPRLLTSYLLFGSQALIPIPDIDRTHFMLILGANPVVSNGSIMTAPDFKRRLAAIQERGGRVVVVDPRRTETAAAADQHHFIRPGADALFLSALLCTIFEERLASPEHAESTELPRLFVPFSPERVTDAVGIAAPAIRELARAFSRAPSAVSYGRMGTCVQEFGTLTTWLIDLLNIVSGNFDRPGGAMFTNPAVDLAGVAARLGQNGQFGRWRSRVGGLPEFNGELPVAALADEIETPGSGQVRALVTYAGNPVLSLPNGKRLARALSGLEFMVSMDLYLNETTRHANLILPTTFGLEHDHYPLAFHALAVHNTARYSPALVAPPGDVRHGWHIMLDLASRLVARRGVLGRWIAGPFHWLAHRIGPRGFLRWALRFGPHGKRWNPFGRGLTFAQLEREVHGIDLGPLEAKLRALFEREGRAIQLAPEPLVADLTRLRARLDQSAAASSRGDPGRLLLIGRRQLRSNNSWMHNSARLVKGKKRCTLMMNPADAAARKIQSGDRVTLASRVGAIDVEVEITSDLMAGVVSLPHGWGHKDEGARLRVASQHGGASINDVTDDKLFDAVSGCTALSGVEVAVTRAEKVDEAQGGARAEREPVAHPG